MWPPKPDNLSAGARVVVTGGSGFIGANLVRLLLDRGYEVTVFDDLSEGRKEYLEGLPITFIRGDVLDRDLVGRTVASCDGVVHLAAQTGVPTSLEDPRLDCRVNVEGTLNLLEACRHAPEKPPRVVFASSNAPLGRQTPPAQEDKAPLPVSPYGASKLAGEAYCLAYHGSWDVRTTVLRFGNVYGPFSGHKRSVVAAFLQDVVERGAITVDGEGAQTRDFIYVGDLCRAILAALESDVSGEVFQVATGVETSILELADMVEELIDEDFDISHGPPRRGDVDKNYSEVSKIESMLGWKPETTLRRGLRNTWEWFRSNGKRTVGISARDSEEAESLEPRS